MEEKKAHYLTLQNCKIEKKHYSVLIGIVQEWEDFYWDDSKPEHRNISFSAKAFAGIQLFRELNILATGTIECLYNRELAEKNPMLEWSTELATDELKEEAELSLKQKLEVNPSLLYEVSPGLKEKVDNCICIFTEMMDEMLDRLYKDAAKIGEAFFGGDNPGSIIAFDSNGADCHNYGRCAFVITSKRGKFVYKPRSMKADALLYSMTHRLFSDTVILPKAIDMGDYGYAEFIESSHAQGDEEAAAFFEHLGGTCALFQIFGSTDFHAENILCAGIYPALVDLETFLSAGRGLPGIKCDAFTQDYINSIALSSILPKRLTNREVSPLLCRDEHSILPVVNGRYVDVRCYFDEFSNGFRNIYRRCMEQKDLLSDYLAQLSECSFRCLIKSTDGYARLIQEFCSVRVLSDEAAAEKLSKSFVSMMSEGGTPKAQEHNCAIAVNELETLLRGDIPIYYCYGNSRDLFIHKKVNHDGLANGEKNAGAVAGGEITDAFAGEKTAGAVAGGEITEYMLLKDFYDLSAGERVKIRMEKMSEAECDFELVIIRRALEHAHIRKEASNFAVTAHTGQAEADFTVTAHAGQSEVNFAKVQDDVNLRNESVGTTVYRKDISDRKNKRQFISFANEAKLALTGLWEKRVISPSGAVGWLDHRTETSSFGILPINYGLGFGGTAAFAAEYYSLTEDERAARIVSDFMDNVMQMTKQLKGEQNRMGIQSISGISGLSGAVKTILLAANTMKSAEYLNCAYDIVSAFGAVSPDEKTMVDFYSGLAGSLYVICTSPEFWDASLLKQTAGTTHDVREFRSLARSLTDRILERRTLETKYGIRGWDCIGKKRPISGLGHGIAGIGLALTAALRLFPDDNELRTAIQDAFALEHEMYSEKLTTWPDFRVSSSPAAIMHGFCSGAPGIGSVYLKLLELQANGYMEASESMKPANGCAAEKHDIQDFRYMEDLERAISACLTRDVSDRDHYCCGNAASIEFLFDAGRKLDRPDIVEVATKRLEKICKRACDCGEYTFLPHDYVNFSPVSLLNGLPGIGHVLLKADNPSLTPMLL